MVSLIAIGGVSVKKLIFIVGACVLWFASASADQYVNGYTKSNGTYVQGYTRTSPNRTTSDNYSTKGNINPYTGQEGTKNEYPQNGNNMYNMYNNSNSKNKY